MFPVLATNIGLESHRIRPLMQTIAVSGNPENPPRNRYVIVEKQHPLWRGKTRLVQRIAL
jgi:hypothetical protein